MSLEKPDSSTQLLDQEFELLLDEINPEPVDLNTTCMRETHNLVIECFTLAGLITNDQTKEMRQSRIITIDNFYGDESTYLSYYYTVMAISSLVESIEDESLCYDSEPVADILCDNFIPEQIAQLDENDQERTYYALSLLLDKTVPSIDKQPILDQIRDESQSAEVGPFNKRSYRALLASDILFVEGAFNVFKGYHDDNAEDAKNFIDSILGILRTTAKYNSDETPLGEKHLCMMGIDQFKRKISELSNDIPELIELAETLGGEYYSKYFAE